MLKLFNKSQKSAEGTSSSQYSSDIEMIHHEFDIAAETLYKEAVAIITKVGPINEDKTERLKALGFNSVPEVKEVAQKKQQIEMSVAMRDMINEYKRKYPFNKFITDEQVKTICMKYGLIYGETSRYKGFVPEKNLKEIETFVKQYKFDKTAIAIPFATALPTFVPQKDRPRYVIDLSDAEMEKSTLDPTKSVMVSKANRMRMQHAGDNKFYGSIQIDGRMIHADMEIIGLQIAAPFKDFNTQGMDVEDYKLVQKHVPDPVVLQPIKGGYLIVTAWGDEASDPLVMNEINN